VKTNLQLQYRTKRSFIPLFVKRNEKNKRVGEYCNLCRYHCR